MTGKRGQSGAEAKLWAKVYRRPTGVVHVTIPPRLLAEAQVPRDVDLVVRRTAYRDRKAIVLEFREASKVPESDRA